MPYFNTHGVFLLPSFDMDAEEKGKIDRFLDLLDDSGVADVISPYVRNGTPKGGRRGFNYYYLFATILHGFAFKRYTLRELEEACKFDLRFIYLMDQQRPSYSSICDFINKVIAPNEERIFALVNKRVAGEVGIDLPDADAYIDGTKQEANANKYKFVWKPTAFHRRITLRAEKVIRELSLIAGYSHVDLIKSVTVARALTSLEGMRGSVGEKAYERHSRELSLILGKVLEYEEKERICGPDRKSYYKTDHGATAMALKADYYAGLGSHMHAAYNVQNLVIRGFSLSYHVSQSRTDVNDFIDVIERFHAMYGCYPKNVCADAGYGSLANYRYLSENGIGNYVKHQSWQGNKDGTFPDCFDFNADGTITCLNGNVGREVALENRHPKKAGAAFYRVDGCSSCGFADYCKKFMRNTAEDFKIFEAVREFEELKKEAEDNLLSVKGIELRVNRSIYVEGDFGVLKQDYGFDRFRRRGLQKVSAEFMLHALGLNVAKLFRFYEKGRLTMPWAAPPGTKPDAFKKPSMKKLSKKGKQINRKQYGGDGRK